MGAAGEQVTNEQRPAGRALTGFTQVSSGTYRDVTDAGAGSAEITRTGA
jgi:hypothetical protein